MAPPAWGFIREPFSGAWQRKRSEWVGDVLTNSAVYACVSLISTDIAKLRIKLVKQDVDGIIWDETASNAFTPVLTKPNHYQNRIQFVQQWIISKLVHGNAYILKERDNRGVVVALYVLHPERCRPLITQGGEVYYSVSQDTLSGVITGGITVPASEIIHDMMTALYHPLVGISPIRACALAANQAIKIQEHSERFFRNGANPGGILTAPGLIPQETADRIKREWEARYTGENVGRVAVLGDGLTYAGMSVNAVDAQLIEQLKWTSEDVAACFHVPAYMIGAGPPPVHANVQASNQQYYSQCLQGLIEALELCLDEGLGLNQVQGKTYGTEVDLDGLLRMDTATQVTAAVAGISGGLIAPNEGRRKLDLPPVPGGDTPYLQQQNYSLSALSKRDAKEDPFGTAKPPAPPTDVPALPAPIKAVGEDTRGVFAATLAKELELDLAA